MQQHRNQVQRTGLAHVQTVNLPTLRYAWDTCRSWAAARMRICAKVQGLQTVDK